MSNFDRDSIGKVNDARFVLFVVQNVSLVFRFVPIHFRRKSKISIGDVARFA